MYDNMQIQERVEVKFVNVLALKCLKRPILTIPFVQFIYTLTK